jgi:hypothetical protein
MWLHALSPLAKDDKENFTFKCSHLMLSWQEAAHYIIPAGIVAAFASVRMEKKCDSVRRKQIVMRYDTSSCVCVTDPAGSWGPCICTSWLRTVTYSVYPSWFAFVILASVVIMKCLVCELRFRCIITFGISAVISWRNWWVVHMLFRLSFVGFWIHGARNRKLYDDAAQCNYRRLSIVLFYSCLKLIHIGLFWSNLPSYFWRMILRSLQFGWTVFACWSGVTCFCVLFM